MPPWSGMSILRLNGTADVDYCAGRTLFRGSAKTPPARNAFLPLPFSIGPQLLEGFSAGECIGRNDS